MSSSQEDVFSSSTAKIKTGLESVFFKVPAGADESSATATATTATYTATDATNATTEEGELSAGELSLPLNDLSVLPPFLPGLSSLPEDPPARTTPVKELFFQVIKKSSSD